MNNYPLPIRPPLVEIIPQTEIPYKQNQGNILPMVWMPLAILPR